MESLTGRAQPTTYNELPQLFDDVRTILFPNFPIYKEEHRKELENLIMGKFLTREIAFTPFAQWHFKFQQRMLLIMPYYNKLYKLMEQDINLFDDVNYTRDINNNGSVVMKKGTRDESTQTGDTTTNGSFMPGTQQVITNTTTPQTNLSDFLDNSYVSSASKSNNSGEDTSLNTVNASSTGAVERSGQDEDIEDRHILEKVTGKRGSKTYLELMQDAQTAIFSVDNMILNDLEEMFFMVY